MEISSETEGRPSEPAGASKGAHVVYLIARNLDGERSLSSFRFQTRESALAFAREATELSDPPVSTAFYNGRAFQLGVEVSHTFELLRLGNGHTPLASELAESSGERKVWGFEERLSRSFDDGEAQLALVRSALRAESEAAQREFEAAESLDGGGRCLEGL